MYMEYTEYGVRNMEYTEYGAQNMSKGYGVYGRWGHSCIWCIWSGLSREYRVSVNGIAKSCKGTA